MTDTPTRSFADVMKAPGNGRATATHVLHLSTDLQEQYADLDRELAEVRLAERESERDATDGTAPKTRRLAGGRRTSRDVVADMDALVEANPDASWPAKLKAARADEWQQLRAEHPPRDDVEEDQIGVNVETFTRAAIRACMLDPDPSDAAQWEFLEDTLNSGEWDRLFLAVWNLNEGHRTRPFSALATSIRGGSSEDSVRPRRLGSLSAGSTAGSRPSDTSISTPTGD